MERKEFLRKFLYGSGLLMAAPLVFNACSKKENDPDNPDNGANDITVDLNSSTYSALKTVGGYAYSGNIIIMRTGETQYLALSKVCTHQSCTVEYSGSQLVCPCHQSKFDTNGNVLQGPATSALEKFTVTLNGSTLKIK
jgi:cytochrome b6-f complex iron-sulfur subunit